MKEKSIQQKIKKLENELERGRETQGYIGKLLPQLTQGQQKKFSIIYYGYPDIDFSCLRGAELSVKKATQKNAEHRILLMKKIEDFKEDFFQLHPGAQEDLLEFEPQIDAYIEDAAVKEKLKDSLISDDKAQDFLDSLPTISDPNNGECLGCKLTTELKECEAKLASLEIRLNISEVLRKDQVSAMGVLNHVMKEHVAKKQRRI